MLGFILQRFLNPKNKDYTMGRIKSKVVKRTSWALLKENNRFTEEFNENKLIIATGLTPSKKVRNQIAGYITRIKKKHLMSKFEI